ncbi:hypothetical protein Syun_002000 [Stephania yunnanensis]|uniref:Uncharacterized protein n=1 Tax=Stephania yunnanensis TaxID=152371 RepID=A0AAP0LHV6_9MAGN
MSDVDEEDDENDNSEFSSNDEDEVTPHRLVRAQVEDSVDNLVVDPADDPALLEINDRMDRTVVLIMMLLHLHRLVRVIRMYSTLLSSLPILPVDGRDIHATAGGAGGGDGAGFSRSISSPNELVELLRRDFRAMQTHIFRAMQDHTLTQDQLREVQGQLNRMEQALMDRLGISFAPAPSRDVPTDDPETDDDLDD